MIRDPELSRLNEFYPNEVAVREAIVYHETRHNRLSSHEAQRNNDNSIDNLKRLARLRGYDLTDPSTAR
jgi:hypothetical protein